MKDKILTYQQDRNPEKVFYFKVIRENTDRLICSIRTVDKQTKTITKVNGYATFRKENYKDYLIETNNKQIFE